MFEFFSTREVALAIYLVLFLVYVFATIKDYTVFTNLIKASFKKVFIVPILCLLVFAVLTVFCLQFSSLWRWALIKDVFIWVLFVATPICFRVATRQSGIEYSFRKMVLDNFVGSAVLEFFIGSFTFSFWWELFVVPIFTLIVLLQNHDRGNANYVKVHKFLDGVSVVIGLLLLLFTIDKAISVIMQDGLADVLISFCIPIILSIVFLPIVYFVALNAAYNDLFTRIRIRNKDGDEVLAAKKKSVFSACRLSYRRVMHFITVYHIEYIGKVCFGNDDDSFLSFVDSFKNNRKNKN